MIFTLEQLKDAAACSNFMQRVKMAYWKQNEGKLCLTDHDLNEVLILAWEDNKKHYVHTP